MADIIHRIGIKAPAEQVYKAISTIKGLSGWWTEKVEGDEQQGGKISFHFQTKTGETLGSMTMEVQKLAPSTEIQWRCIDGPPEWIGTSISFELSEQDGQTILLFGHRNWKDPVEFMAHCSMKWAVFLLSLREYVETGKGKPSPGDMKIDNWN
jgi:uncharacterized protein YndB with AHSA1/START domain